MMKPLFALSPIAFLILMFLCVNIITNFAQNTIVIIIFLPLFLTYGQATGFPMEGFYILIIPVSTNGIGYAWFIYSVWGYLFSNRFSRFKNGFKDSFNCHANSFCCIDGIRLTLDIYLILIRKIVIL